MATASDDSFIMITLGGVNVVVDSIDTIYLRRIKVNDDGTSSFNDIFEVTVTSNGVRRGPLLVAHDMYTMLSNAKKQHSSRQGGRQNKLSELNKLADAHE